MADNSDYLSELEQLLGVKFHNTAILETALTHSSFSFEKRTDGCNNERMEFLGDAVLELCVSDNLFKHSVNMPEGEMTKRRSNVVCEKSLAAKASEFSVGKYLRLGKGEDVTGGRERASILSDAFEAIIGALYIDQGYDAVLNFVNRIFGEELRRTEQRSDYKSELQEYVQNDLGLQSDDIEYNVVSCSGPDHDKNYEVALFIKKEKYGYGSGRSKKNAEQSAAKQALQKVEKSK
ncbi:MAG: ribonuclease III [Negativicutes bacterium]|jgi:ribonuclease-3